MVMREGVRWVGDGDEGGGQVGGWVMVMMEDSGGWVMVVGKRG